MQILVKVNLSPEEYFSHGKNLDFLLSPNQCPHPDCLAKVQLKKHGFYERNLIEAGFENKIFIRRYRCPICGKTVSLLPDFCLPYFQYGLNIIFKYILKWVDYSDTLKSFINIMNSMFNDIEIKRQHVFFYTKRFFTKLPLIESFIRDKYTETVVPNEKYGEKERAKRHIEIIIDKFININNFSQKYQNKYTKGFLAP